MATDSIEQNPVGDYVYELLVDGIVRYVGKGRGNRARRHIGTARGVLRRREAGETVKTQKLYNQLAKAIKRGATVTYRIVAEGLNEMEAFALEVETIALREGLWNRTPGGQGASSEHFKRNWADEAIRAKMMAAFTSPEVVEARKRMAAAQWADPAAREKNRQRTREQWQDPKFREERLAAIAKSFSPERREAQRRATKAMWDDPIKGKKIREASIAASRRKRGQKMTSPKAIAGFATMGEKARQRWQDPEFKERVSALIREGKRKKSLCST